MKIFDDAIALRVLWLLIQPFEKSDAYKQGVIDKDGTLVKKELSTQAEKNSYTLLHKIVFNVKRLMAKIPGGSSQLATIAAAYFAVKESYETGSEPSLNNISEEQLLSVKSLMEELATTNTSNVAGIKAGDEPPAKMKMPMIRRKIKSFKEFVNVRTN